MDILECLETEAFNELIEFSFEEVRSAFNLNKYFVLNKDGARFSEEAGKIKNWYDEELKQIEEYSKSEYSKMKNLGEDIPEFDEPQYKIKALEIKTKQKLIRLIAKYYNKDLFQYNKKDVYGQGAFKEEAVEIPHELIISLNMHRDRIYSLLSIIGYYQRTRHYFLSSSDFLNICLDYSRQVYYINKNLGMKYRFVNIFISNSRIKPSKGTRYESEDGEDYDEDSLEQYQSNKFIDIDKISLLALIQPYLKHNTQEINKIIEIMISSINVFTGGLTWSEMLEEVNEFIAACEKKGIMKRL